MSRFSLIAPIIFFLASSHAYSQSTEGRILAVQQASLLSLQKQNAELNKKLDEAKITTGDLNKTISAQATEISSLKTEISGLKKETASLQSQITNTAVTFTRIGASPTTGYAACEAVGKQCIASYGGQNIFYPCEHNGSWKKVLCSAEF